MAALDKLVTERVAKIVGVGADQKQQTADNAQAPKSIIAKFRRQPNEHDDFLTALKEGASGKKE
jgi:hypothetical protein